MFKKVIKDLLLFFFSLYKYMGFQSSDEGVIVVLIYHDIPQAQQEAFTQQINMLLQRYTFITPEEFEYMQKTKFIPKGIKLLLTFDDGFKSNRKICEEVLNPLGIKAIFFVLSDLLDADSRTTKKVLQENIFDGVNYKIDPENLLTMDKNDIQFLVNTGHTIGSHTRTHIRLSKIISEDLLRDEIIESGNRLETLCKIKVRHFAYPFGQGRDINKKSMQLACQRYDYVHSGVRGKNRGSVKTKVIFRHEISPEYSTRYVRFLVENGLSFYYIKMRRYLEKMVCDA